MIDAHWDGHQYVAETSAGRAESMDGDEWYEPCGSPVSGGGAREEMDLAIALASMRLIGGPRDGEISA